MSKLKVGFICVHNSCRSQMAEALSKIYASDTYEVFSAGTDERDMINQDAVRIIKELYNYDMNIEQRPKLVETLPELDVVITMGCNVDCPNLPSKHREDWGLDDPSGLPDKEFVRTAKLIESKIFELTKRIKEGQLNL